MQLSVIIVSYNVRPFLQQCIHAVQAATTNITYEIIVVDNNSTDDTAACFITTPENVQFIWNKVNMGFGKANNQGLEIAKGDHVLFLNPDCIVGEHSLQRCMNHIKQTDNCGAVGIHMIDGTGQYLPESKRNLPGLLSSFFYFSGLSNLFPRSGFFNAYHAAGIAVNERKAVPVLSGAFMMATTEVFRAAGGFDPRYFMYGEDVDLSLEIEKEGYCNYYLGDVKMLHYKGESNSKKDGAYYEVFFNAMKLFVKKRHSKWGGTVKTWFIAPIKYLFKLKARLRFTIKKKTNFSVSELALLYCTESERQKIIQLNEQYQFAKKLLFTNGDAQTPPTADLIIYSKSIFTYAELIQRFENGDANVAKFIFHPQFNFMIGSRGKSDAGLVYHL